MALNILMLGLASETSEKGIKQGYKGRDKVATWKRGTDKRSMNFDSLQGA